MLRKSYRNVRNSSRAKKIGQMRVNRGFSGIREAPNAPDLGTTENRFHFEKGGGLDSPASLARCCVLAQYKVLDSRGQSPNGFVRDAH